MKKKDAIMIGMELAIILNLKQEPNGKYLTKMGEKDTVALARMINKIIKKYDPTANDVEQ